MIMDNIKSCTFSSKTDLADQLASDIAQMLTHAIDAKGSATLAVSGGSTPKLLFQTLSKTDIDWQKVTILLVDERFVPPTDERSNEKLVRDNLLKNAAQAANMFGLWVEGETIHGARHHLDAKIKALGALDVVILGMGTDGHTASFFPGGSNLESALNMSCGQSILDMQAEGAGEPRLTLTLPNIIRADQILLHIEGDSKLKVLKEAMAHMSDEHLPIRTVIDASPSPVALYWAP